MNQQHILIVEDSKAVAMMASKKIRDKLNMPTVLATSLAETQQLLETNSYSFFAAVLDLTLPDAPNGEVVDYVLSRGVRSIVLTGTFGEEWRETLLAKNVVDYVIKKNIHDYDYIAFLIQRLQKNSQIKVLIVDDSMSYRSYLRRLLSTQNFQVLEAEDGLKALEILKAHPDIRMVVTDYMMPNMDGIELVTEIRQSYSKEHIAILGISSENDSVLSARFLKTGVNDFLRKPFATEEFNCRIMQNIEMIEQIEEIRQSLDLRNKFLGIAAHDLRNPLGSIRGFSMLMQGGACGPVTPKQDKYLNTIIRVSDHMLSLINDLLDISVIESGHLTLESQNGQLQPLVEERIRINQVVAEQKQIQIHEDWQITLPDLEFDANRIAQVLDNLLSNAIKFSPPGSHIWVSLEKKDDDEAILKVRDEGPGISLEDQAKLFGEFQRLSNQPTGGERSTGLGLAIVKKMLDAHGWKIRVESELGMGTSFCLRIPLK